MATAHNVKDMTPRDGKFQFRLKGIGGKAARFVWGYVIEAATFQIVKLDGEHTYLWVNDPRIDQIILQFQQGGTYEERQQARYAKMQGCRGSSDGEVCLWAGCPLLGDREPGFLPDNTGPCPLDRDRDQDELGLEG
jgi:hypothetical protein